MRSVMFFVVLVTTLIACADVADGTATTHSEINHNGSEYKVRFDANNIRTTTPNPGLQVPGQDSQHIWHFGDPSIQLAASLGEVIPDGCTLTKVQAEVQRWESTTTPISFKIVHNSNNGYMYGQVFSGTAPNVGPELLTWVGNRILSSVGTLIVYVQGNGLNQTLSWVDVTFTCQD